MLSCQEVMAELAGYLDDEVAAELRAELERHLSECRICRAFYDTTRKTLKIVTESRSFELPAGLSSRIVTKIMARLRPGHRRRTENGGVRTAGRVASGAPGHPPDRVAPGRRARPRRAKAEEPLALLERVTAGDHQAFEVLARRYMQTIYGQAFNLVGNAADAEEVVQEVLLVVHRKAKTFRGDSAFSTWLYRVTLNAALTRLRQRKRSEEVSIEEFLPRFQEDGHHLVRPVVDWSHEVDARLDSQEFRNGIRQALDLLSPTDRAVVVMSDLEGIANREIGEAVGLSVTAVKARLHRARLFLRGKLAAHLGYSPT